MLVRYYALCLFVVLSIAAISASEAHAYPEWTSYYDPALEGNLTASGEPYSPYLYTCASYEYDFGTTLYLYSDGYYSWCYVNDLGPAAWTTNTLDVSGVVAEELGMVYEGEDWVLIYKVE